MSISHSESLTYRIVAGEMELAPLRILAEDNFLWLDFSVSVYVLGASHAVRLRSPDGVLTEALTCGHFPETAALLTQTAGEASVETENLLVKINLWREPLDSVQPEPHTTGLLEWHFPGTPTPVTRINWVATDRSLTIETLHTYPEEDIAVRSRSIWQIRKKTP